MNSYTNVVIRIVCVVLFAILVPFIIGKMTSRTIKKNQSVELNESLEEFKVRRSKKDWMIGIFVVIYGILLPVIGAIAEVYDELSAQAFFIGLGVMFLCAGLLILYTCFRFQIHVRKDRLVYQPVFGQKQEYLFTEIGLVKYMPFAAGQALHQIELYERGTGRKIVTSNYQYVGNICLYQRLEQEGLPFETIEK